MVPLFALSLAVLAPRLVHPQPPAAVVVPQAADSALDAARGAMSRGLSWRASLILAPVLADPSRRTPEALMLAARAASGWGGWAEVERLIGDAPWLDSAFDGEGRALLARAALARRADSSAAAHATLAVQAAPDSGRRGERLVVLARALDRLDSLSRAATAYAEAARLLPEINQWLIYRAAIVTADAAAREQLFAAIASPVARARLAAARAEALGRSADSASAAEAFAALGDWPAAYRFRLATARSDSARAAFRAELVAIVETRPGTAQARAAIAVLDQQFAPLPPTLELSIGRALASGGSPARVVSAFRKGLADGGGTSRDRYDYARHLFALGRYEDAAAQYRQVREPGSLAATAAYQRARALVRAGNVTAGRAALRAIGPRFPRETEAPALALFLLGDLATDERRDAAAREAFRALATRHPRASVAPAAAFRAAIIAYIDGSARTAATEFDALAERYPESREALAARYWAGRAWSAAGDSATARGRWQQTIAQDPAGYYGGLASRKLGLPPWAPPAVPDRFIPVPDASAALERADRLEGLGLDREAAWERDDVMTADGAGAERLLALADAFRSRAMASRGMRLTWRAIAAGAPRDARTYRLLYPLVHQEALEHEARARNVEPSFAAALIRQESNFTPGATSGAGARGLMQVMPAVGQAVARGLRFPVWDPVLLYQPDVNVQLGMAHLAELLERYDHPVHVLAAYNAGASRVERWKEKRGVADPELFAERIPYAETRDYVRIIQRTMLFYRTLYTWEEPVSLGPAGP